MQHRYDQQSPDEHPSKRQTKVVWIIVAGLAIIIGMWFWIGWYSLLILGVIVWATWDGFGASGRAKEAVEKKGWDAGGSSGG